MTLNKEGYGIVGIAGATTLLVMILLGAVVWRFALPVVVLWIVGILLAAGVFVIALFFREPKRPRVADEGVVFAPADGKVVVIEEVEEREFLNENRIQVSVFMSLSNVHINWFPVGGRVVYRKYHPGDFMVAWHPKSSEENERMTTVVDTGERLILFRQIAGLIARRIVNYAQEGKTVEQNAKCGFIKFGSRVDLFLPTDAEVLVSLNQKVVGSQTPIARLKPDPEKHKPEKNNMS